MEKLIFDYAEFTSRNVGFIRPTDQDTIRKSKLFIAGVGGMGGAVLESLVRLGVGHFVIADFDVFEVSNMNRQIMATLDTVGISKTQATAARMRKINPAVEIIIYGKEWTDNLDTILPSVDFAINGCDDLKATLQLMRKGHEHKKTVIDAFTTTLPSVYVVRPESPRPEEMMGFPTVSVPVKDITQAMEDDCKVQELVYVLTHSSSKDHVIWEYAAEVFEGKRKRFSLSPMVITTGNLMAYEAFKLILGMKSVVDERGVFFNPWKARVERPLKWPLRVIKSWLIRRAIKKMF